ncbi:trans-sulfuration enzyme family protein [Pseudonocardia endophytica]|uniref:homocysteine desulfhydrase n=1 Tax=Pseudonocardia endophytica TaxID=401976 RepID=A0A4R1HUC9_PSEEN|nr:aminotransferase class I/II-fold pyridoxal phosphate-dependent enzyme [Pseudonocardia endophytica]TCK26297.1 cystathionine gamma-synthase [Pseudonocardia endophytica]
MTRHSLTTRAVHSGRHDLVDLGVHAVPIDLSTTYPCRDSRAEAARLDVLGAGADDGGLPVYARVGNPTVARFEHALADLEGAEAGVAFASGMAALSACLLAAVAAGRPHVVAVRPLYGTSDHLLDSSVLGTSITWTTADDVAEAVTDRTGLVVVESPGNPTLNEIDIPALVASVADVPVLVDNTFATPVLQRPLELGAAYVLHSATKYLGGHGDVMGGVIACAEERARPLRQLRFATGAILHPLAGYLLLRGLSTLPMRIRAASQNAAELADRLSRHPAVTRVHYPGLSEPRPAHHMNGGGAIVSIEITGEPADVIAAVRVFTPAVSLGSVDSLIQHPGSLSHHIMDPGEREKAGISEQLLRLSVGIEDLEDLWTDLDEALSSAK